jgi:hypothetical protein
VVRGVVQVAAIAVAATAFVLVFIGVRWQTTVAACPAGPGSAPAMAQSLIFLSPAALFVAGGWSSFCGRIRLASILWILGVIASALMFLAGWLLLIGITMNCADASDSETVYFAAIWAFALAAVLGAAGRLGA